METKEFETKKKDFKKWARNDAKHYLFSNRTTETIEEYFKRIIAHYNKERLMEQFGYTEEQYNEILEWYNESFWEGFNYWQKRKEKTDEILQKYSKIFKEAEAKANKVDVSDIQDGFPCGDCHLYLNPSEKDTELGKALREKNSEYETHPQSLSLPIKFPIYGQCMAFSEKICNELKPFLEKKNIPCLIHRWVD